MFRNILEKSFNKKKKTWFTESCEIAMRSLKWKDTTCSGIRTCNIAKIPILPKATYRVNVIQYKNLNSGFYKKKNSS